VQSALSDTLDGVTPSLEVVEPQSGEIVTDAASGGGILNPSESNHISVLRASRRYELTKRALDLTFGTLGLIGTGIISVALVPYIMRKSPGPAIFRQVRVGWGGRQFTCYKFRTMQIDADERKCEFEHLNEADGPVFKIENDPRHVEGLRWLRKYSLDELPQFWNVVRGDMSLVGPRPPVVEETNLYTPQQLSRLAVKPGLTCIWQVEGRSTLDFETWVAMDLDYIQRRSTRLDLQILAKTVPAVLTGRGAV
jgi:lipopolysaccharide/colanic/teichoic acid biosynthesis glycosyltransferase